VVDITKHFPDIVDDGSSVLECLVVEQGSLLTAPELKTLGDGINEVAYKQVNNQLF
jgi:hypothetical protein